MGQTRDISTPEIVGLIVILVLSLSFHEVAHAWVAWKRGDSTAKDMGRITLDPMVHIDLWWTLIVPAMMYMSFGFIFGGAKPVPVVF
ncbi:MAG: Zn-dependent protease, partial [Planctomycetota bacterium]